MKISEPWCSLASGSITSGGGKALSFEAPACVVLVSSPIQNHSGPLKQNGGL